MKDMPKVEVYIMPSQEALGGVGEPGVPPIAPAVANAVFDATGIAYDYLLMQRSLKGHETLTAFD